MHVHTGDTVQVITGKDKGKVGEVLRVYRKTGKVIVRNANLRWRYEPPQGEGEQGRMYQTEGLLDHSNVMLYSNRYQCRSRVGRTTDSTGSKKRYLVKTGEVRRILLSALA
jgi:large subunit ribosomal protein L24